MVGSGIDGWAADHRLPIFFSDGNLLGAENAR
jgi:hypothetical protein